MKGYYYLHSETADLIFKKYEPESDSPFVRKVWSINTDNRDDAWKVVLEALALNVKLDRAKELASKWNLTFDDSIEMLKHVGKPTDLMAAGMKIFITKILDMHEEDYWDEVKKLW